MDNDFLSTVSGSELVSGALIDFCAGHSLLRLFSPSESTKIWRILTIYMHKSTQTLRHYIKPSGPPGPD